MTGPAAPVGTELQPDDPRWVAERYEVLGVLGRGGMGAVYRVRDVLQGEELALKRLALRAGGAPSPVVVALFEREFHTLMELAHPRVVRVFDYGIDDGTPYYTLELLDGGDLRAQAPMPWPRVCAVAYDICSVLSLLHSRQLVHRDVTPRNIRLTSDGKAKLIDFGLLSPMGPVQRVAGTPPYTAPEVLHQISLDGRGDLFSLGCTLYYALTKCTAFSARGLEGLRDAWRCTPARVAAYAPGVPEALERLVTALMRLDVDSRPRSAAEVMDRLRPLLPAAPDETLSVARAHLSAPALVARSEAQVRIRKQLIRAARGRGGGFLISGEAGTGRSRMLDVFAMEAKLLGGIAARVGAADAAGGPFAAARALASQIHMQAPRASVEAARHDDQVRRVLFGDQALEDSASCRVEDLSRPGLTRAQVQAALRSWILAIAVGRPVALAVDDLDSLDEPSAALVAALSVAAGATRCAYAVVASSDGRDGAARSVLEEHGRPMELAPLSLGESEQLLQSVFGNVPNLQVTSRTLYALSGGKPRDCMELAQHLVDRGVIVYENGGWQLPDEVDPSALPPNMEAALAARIDRLSPVAHDVARALALHVLGRLSLNDLGTIVDASVPALTAAADELRRAHLLTGGPDGYSLVDAARAQVAVQTDAPQLHDRLAELLERKDAPPPVSAHHRLRGARPVDAALALAAAMRAAGEGRTRVGISSIETIGSDATAAVFADAERIASAAKRSVAERFPLWFMLAGAIANGARAEFLLQVPATWLQVLKRDSGWNHWCELSDITDPVARTAAALTNAAEHYESMEACDRVLSPFDAIKELAAYVALSIAFAARVGDQALLASLPALLYPFAHLHPLLDAMHRNVEAVLSTKAGGYETSRTMVLDLIERLQAPELADDVLARRVLDASRLHLRSLDIFLGTDVHDRDSLQAVVEPSDKVHAAHLEAMAARFRGDGPAVDAYLRRAELIALEHRTAGIFSSLEGDLTGCAVLEDLTGLKRVREQLERVAADQPGHVPIALMADAHYHRLRGELDRALSALGALRANPTVVASPPAILYSAVALEAEILTAQGQPRRAKELGEPLLEQCQARNLRAKHRELACSLALADAALGDHAQARARLEAAIAEQQALGVSHFARGLKYEYLARVAISAGDVAGFQRAAGVVAEAYRVDDNSMLAGRYRRLLEEAQQATPMGRPAAGAHAGVARGLDGSAPNAEGPDALSCASQDILSRLCRSGTVLDGWLFALTDAGFERVASTRPPEDDEALMAYAQAQLELELDDGACTATDALSQSLSPETALTMTGAPAMTEMTVATLAEEPPGHVQRAIPLRTQRDGHTYVVGVVVFVGVPAAAGEAERLVAELAQRLMDAGTCRPREAA